MNTQEIKLEMQGLDKRTKRYKELEAKLYSIMSFEESQEDDLKEVEYAEEEQEEIEYIEYIEKDEIDYKVSDEIYNIVKGFNGRVPSGRLSWLFKTYNKLFNQRLTQCLCPGKIKKMVIKTIKTYEKERR